MYQRLPSWVLGFHGTDQETVDRIVRSNTAHLNASTNEWDWLGNGIYFWENDPVRALQFARERMAWKKITDKTPAVIGAVIDLGYCLNLFDQPALQQLAVAHQDLSNDMALLEVDMPTNSDPAGNADLRMRHLDRAVIEHLHRMRRIAKEPAYQTVRSGFHEGKAAFDGSAFKSKNHIQIAVCHKNSIKGYFLPRQAQPDPPRRRNRSAV